MPGGKIFYQEWRNRAFFDKTGKAIHFLAIGFDVTERKEIENALKDSEEKYRTLFDSSSNGIGIATLEGKPLFMNRVMEIITGYSAEDFDTLRIHDQFVDSEKWDKMKVQLIKTGEVKNLETQLKKKDGIIYEAQMNLNLIKMGSEQVMMTNLGDVTEINRIYKEQRENEERLKQIADSSVG